MTDSGAGALLLPYTPSGLKREAVFVELFSWDSLSECRTHDRKVGSSNPGRSGGRIFLCSVNFVCGHLFGVRSTSRVTVVAHRRHWSLCQKCRWQFSPKHAYTLDSTKLEWAHYAAVQAQCGNPIRKRAHTQLIRKHSVMVVSAC